MGIWILQILKSVCVPIAAAGIAMGSIGCSMLRTEWYRGETRHLYEKGCSAYRAGDLSGAGEALTQVVTLDPAHARAHVALGHVALASGDLRAAAASYRKALTLAPDLRDAVGPMLLHAELTYQQEIVRETGADLKTVLQFLEGGDDDAIAAFFAGVCCPGVLSGDAFSLSLTERDRLRQLVIVRLLTGRTTPGERLFSGLFLSREGTMAPLAARTLESWLAANDRGPGTDIARQTLIGLYVGRGDRTRAMAATAGDIPTENGEAATARVFETMLPLVPTESLSKTIETNAPGSDPEAPAPNPFWLRLTTTN